MGSSTMESKSFRDSQSKKEAYQSQTSQHRLFYAEAQSTTAGKKRV